MLLRRVTAHVKAQNWFAVFLDFLIVVVGVFIGLQVANWNEGLNDEQRAESYRARLIEDMELNQQTLSGRQKSYATQIEYGLFAIEAPSEATDSEAAWKVVRAFFQASHVFTITLQRGTYDEMISSGGLTLLGDQNLVNALSEFYSFGGLTTVQDFPKYREKVRRLIPFELQRYLQNECYLIEVPDIHQLLDCPPPDNADDLIEVASIIQADEELKRDLQYMISFAGVSTDIARNRINRVDAVLAILSQEPETGKD